MKRLPLTGSRHTPASKVDPKMRTVLTMDLCPSVWPSAIPTAHLAQLREYPEVTVPLCGRYTAVSSCPPFSSFPAVHGSPGPSHSLLKLSGFDPLRDVCPLWPFLWPSPHHGPFSAQLGNQQPSDSTL